MKKEKFYITTAIAYVNAKPHIGHALEFCQADVLARYARSKGKDVWFLTGTDEHGTKIQQAARDQKISPQELADENSAHVREMADSLNISYDDFIRTSSDLHKQGAQKLWLEIDAAGKFYEKEYQGYYCVGCEAFVLERDLVDGLCPLHQKPPELLKEKNYFFKLSDFSDAILKKVESNELLIRPASRRNEFLSLLREGLEDVSFSRPKKTLAWGVDVPNDPDQVMYVWCDALSNYLTALGYANHDPKVERFWPADVHLIGKDITRFHCAYWIGMLMAAGLPLPKSVYVHGFITSEGQKMSKSLGNVVDPHELLEQWGTDALRYYLLREIPTGDDGDFSRERFRILYEEELANTMGNLARRVAAMTIKYFDGVPPKADKTLDKNIEGWKLHYEQELENFNIKAAIEVVLDLAYFANHYVDENKPWELAKTNSKKLAPVMGNLVRLCQELAQLLAPILPETASRIENQFAAKKIEIGEPLFAPVASIIPPKA